MGQSLSKIYVHLTFGTKNRHPFLHEEFRKRLHAYLGSTLKTYDSPAIVMDSVKDHIHILFVLSKNHALAKIVEEVKKQSSKWLKQIDHCDKNFAWQDGYAAFSVGSSQIQVLTKYIANQKQHHQKISFREEVESFLKKYDVINYNELYFWR